MPVDWSKIGICVYSAKKMTKFGWSELHILMSLHVLLTVTKKSIWNLKALKDPKK